MHIAKQEDIRFFEPIKRATQWAPIHLRAEIYGIVDTVKEPHAVLITNTTSQSDMIRLQTTIEVIRPAPPRWDNKELASSEIGRPQILAAAAPQHDVLTPNGRIWSGVL